MKLTIFNGSPKLGRGNTDVMLEHFTAGFCLESGNEYEIFKLNKFTTLEDTVRIFEESELILLAFPLYTYAMPGGVKSFIEALQPLCGKCSDKKIAFLVQFGFPEAIHARPLERYLVNLSRILGCEYLGTIIKGGCDGLAAGRGMGNKSILKGIYNIGVSFGKTCMLNSDELNAYSAPEFEKQHNRFIMKIILKLINRFYWGAAIKRNGVTIEESYAKPDENP
jgi:multimeric flavodoxin WrbA